MINDSSSFRYAYLCCRYGYNAHSPYLPLSLSLSRPQFAALSFYNAFSLPLFILVPLPFAPVRTLLTLVNISGAKVERGQVNGCLASATRAHPHSSFPLFPLICHLSLPLSSDIPAYPVSLLLRLLLFVLRSGFDKFVMRRCLRCHIIMLTCQKRQPIILLWLTPHSPFLYTIPLSHTPSPCLAHLVSSAFCL